MTLTDLENWFWRATVMCLGLDPDDTSEAVQSRVRISWTFGNTNWTPQDSVAFLRISGINDNYAVLHDRYTTYDPETGKCKTHVRYHRSYQINWICYGPTADEDADKIRIGLFATDIHEMLIAQNIAPFVQMREPIRAPEQEQSGEWFERVDVIGECYVLTERVYDEGYIDAPPTIYVNDYD